MRNGEKYQLELVVQDYASRGYRVLREWRLEGTEFRFDAVALREADSSMVVIEIVNATRSDAQIEQRRAAFSRLAEAYPAAHVDLRHVDLALPQWASQRLAAQETSRDVLLDTAAYLYEWQPTALLLWLWSHHAAMLREYVRLTDKKLHGDSKDILTIYNELLASERLRAPESVAEEVELDLGQLYERVRAAIEGCPITTGEAEQMRGHVVSVREQIRQALLG